LHPERLSSWSIAFFRWLYFSNDFVVCKKF
jgi:hypothetical protein